MFIGRTNAEAETPILWPPHAKSWLIGKDSDAGRDWGQEEKGMTEDEMAGWHHRLNGHEFGWTQGVGDGQGGLACCNSWGCKESDTIEWLNWTEGSQREAKEITVWSRTRRRLNINMQNLNGFIVFITTLLAQKSPNSSVWLSRLSSNPTLPV